MKVTTLKDYFIDTVFFWPVDARVSAVTTRSHTRYPSQPPRKLALRAGSAAAMLLLAHAMLSACTTGATASCRTTHPTGKGFCSRATLCSRRTMTAASWRPAQDLETALMLRFRLLQVAAPACASSALRASESSEGLRLSACLLHVLAG